MDVYEEMPEDSCECAWCLAWVDRAESVDLWDPATLACDRVCRACDRAYWSAPLVVGADGYAYRAMGEES